MQSAKLGFTIVIILHHSRFLPPDDADIKSFLCRYDADNMLLFVVG
jgi:hypothetical protein